MSSSEIKTLSEIFLSQEWDLVKLADTYFWTMTSGEINKLIDSIYEKQLIHDLSDGNKPYDFLRARIRHAIVCELDFPYMLYLKSPVSQA